MATENRVDRGSIGRRIVALSYDTVPGTVY